MFYIVTFILFIVLSVLFTPLIAAVILFVIYCIAGEL